MKMIENDFFFQFQNFYKNQKNYCKDNSQKIIEIFENVAKIVEIIIVKI